MTLAPILERELRLRARHRATYRLRLGAGLLGMLICVPQLAFVSPFVAPGMMGQSPFNGLVGAAFVLSCAACLFTADTIASERREGTLGLLLLTRVKGVDVLLGKLGSAGITGLCALLAFLPILMLPVLAGGVTGGEAARKGLVLVNTLFFALAAGLYESAASRERFRTALRAAVMIALIVLVPAIPVLRYMPLSLWHLLSPLSGMSFAADFAYRRSAAEYWVALLVVHGLAWLLLAGANLRMRRNVGEAGRSQAALARPIKRSRRRLESVAASGNPVGWLVCRQRSLRTAIWVAAAVSVLNQLASMVFRPYSFLFRRPGYLFMSVTQWPWLAFHLLYGALFAWAASRFFFEARRTGELELLLTTPLGAEQVVAGQWRALKRLLLWPILVILLAVAARTIVPILGGWYYQYLLATYPSGQAYMLATVIVSLAYPIAGVAALCWLGLWYGLQAPSQGSAILRTIGLGQAVPYVVGLLSPLLLAPLSFLFFSSYGPLPLAAALGPSLSQIVVLLYLIWVIRWARRRLDRELARGEPVRFTLRHAVAVA